MSTIAREWGPLHSGRPVHKRPSKNNGHVSSKQSASILHESFPFLTFQTLFTHIDTSDLLLVESDS